jgi:hypothetical protein
MILNVIVEFTYGNASTLSRMLALFLSQHDSLAWVHFGFTYAQHSGNNDLGNGVGGCLNNPADGDQNIANDNTVPSPERHPNDHD